LLRLSKFIDKRIFTLFAGGGTVEDLLAVARVNERIAEALQVGTTQSKTAQHEVEGEGDFSPTRLLDIAG